MLNLRHTRPLFVGGTRYVFRHPEHHGRCIKVLRPDHTGAARKRLRRDGQRFLAAGIREVEDAVRPQRILSRNLLPR